MFGVTTACVTEARRLLEERGYEVLVFHAVGTGGEAFETLASGGFFADVRDATTTELADELVGGVFSAGPSRLTAAGAAGLPQAVSLGALDMVNFGPRETVPPQFADRTLYFHNPAITLLRTTPRSAPNSDGGSPRASRGRPARPPSSSPCAGCRRSPRRGAFSTIPPPTRPSLPRYGRAWGRRWSCTNSTWRSTIRASRRR